MSLQAFKETDLVETKVKNCFLPSLDTRSDDRDDFYEGAYECYLFGDVLFALERSPLATVITQDTFRTSFYAIHALFKRPGTFEFYMDVFRAIWGDDVEVTFTIPAAGKLQIEIGAIHPTTDTFEARRIASNAYVYEDVLTIAGDTLLFQSFVGVKTQSEVDALMNELKPAGIWTETSLVVGS